MQNGELKNDNPNILDQMSKLVTDLKKRYSRLSKTWHKILESGLNLNDADRERIGIKLESLINTLSEERSNLIESISLFKDDKMIDAKFLKSIHKLIENSSNLDHTLRSVMVLIPLEMSRRLKNQIFSLSNNIIIKELMEKII